MALRTKLRSPTLHRHRVFSTSVLNPDSKTPLTSHEKSRAALALLRLETSPERILEICRAAALSPASHLDRLSFSKAISKLRKSNYYEGIREFINESLSGPEPKSDWFISHFIVLYGRAGLIKDAIKLFDEMPSMGVSRSAKSLNSLLFSCLLAGEYGEMKRIFSDFPANYGLEPNLDTYNTILKGFCESNSSNAAYSILAEMERKGVKPNAATFATVFAGFYSEEKFEDVGKMVELMKKHGVQQGIGIYNVRIQSLCRLKRSSEAIALFDGLLIRGMKPNCVTYYHLIHGFCREGNFDVAKNLYNDMISKRLQPEADCYYTMVYFLCKGREYEAAFRICRDCMAKGLVPNFTIMKSLVRGLASIEKLDEAKEIIGQLKEKFPNDADKWSEIEGGLSK